MNHSPERRQLIEELIAKWRLRLCLTDWDIRLCDDKPDADTRGTTTFWDGKRAALVRIDPAASDDALEEIVLHELIHCLWQPVIEAFESILNRHVSKAALETLKPLLGTPQEVSIQHTVRAFLGHGPTVYDATDPWSRVFDGS